MMLRRLSGRVGVRSATFGVRRASFHFGTPEFHSTFLPAVDVDREALRAQAVEALQIRNEQEWYQSPVVSMLNGHALDGGLVTSTTDAFGRENGSQLLATDAEVDLLASHAASFRPERADLREGVRRAEAQMLSVHAGTLIANHTI